MSDLMRIGLIEIGSSTIRYSVLDFGAGMNFKLQRGETFKHDLKPLNPTQDAIDAINRKVEEYGANAGEYSCDKVLAYGTAACRLAAARFPGRLSHGIRVLTTAEEARVSWVSGFACMPSSSNNACTVIDLGDGSTEVVSARWSNGAISNLSSGSVEIGGAYLAEMLKADPLSHLANTAKLIRDVKERLGRAGLASLAIGRVYLVGGVATRIGWLASGRSSSEPYRPEKVNGVEVTQDQLVRLYQLIFETWHRDKEAGQALVDSRQGSQDYAERVLSSIPFITLLAFHLDPQGTYYVSGYGLRHGMAYLIRRNQQGFDL